MNLYFVIIELIILKIFQKKIVIINYISIKLLGRHLRFFLFNNTSIKNHYVFFTPYFFFFLYKKYQKLWFLFFIKKPLLFCGRSYFFLHKECFLNFSHFSKIQKFWFLTNLKNFSVPLRYYTTKFKINCGVLLANFPTYWLFRVAIFQNKVEFLVFYNSPSFLGIYNSKHHFNKVFYLIKQKTFWLRRLRSRFFKLYFYNKNTKFST